MASPPKKFCYTEMTVSSQSPNFSQEEMKPTYKILTTDDLKPEMKRITQETAEILGYPATVCRILLHHSKWFSESLLENFYAEDPERFFAKFNLKNQPTMLEGADDYYGVDCEICFNRQKATCIECGHKFCYECWDCYLKEQVKSQAQPYITCPAYKCRMVLSDEVAHELMASENTEKAYDKLIMRSFVENNRLMRFCPGQECDRIVQLTDGTISLLADTPITCNGCYTTFCFICGQQWHAPMKCDLLKQWLLQVDEDKGTYAYLEKYTKDCPRCKSSIEKNGGCNHMTCRKCTYEFCWICRGDWKNHAQAYNCNRYQEGKNESDEHEGREKMKRYLFYYERFMNHQNSLKLENKLHNEVQKQMRFLQSKDYSYIETRFMEDAVAILYECRGSLMYTYGFAYYLEKSPQVEIFEENQSNLELATEALSGLLEKDLQEMIESAELDMKATLDKYRTDVQDKAKYVSQRRIILMEHCAEGYDKDFDYWKFKDQKKI